MSMPHLTFLYAALLIALGLLGYLLTGGASVTALIPSFFGIAFLVAGVLALKENLRKHAMHAASLLALVAMIGSTGGIPALIRMLEGQDVERPEAAVCKSVMAVLSLAYFGMCLGSFVKARIARR